MNSQLVGVHRGSFEWSLLNSSNSARFIMFNLVSYVGDSQEMSKEREFRILQRMGWYSP